MLSVSGDKSHSFSGTGRGGAVGDPVTGEIYAPDFRQMGTGDIENSSCIC